MMNNDYEGQSCENILLANPMGLDFDSDGNLYIADRLNHLVKFVRRWWP